jgi:hypothetical protein
MRVSFAILALLLTMVVDGFLHPNRPMPPAPVAFQKALDR